MTYCHACGDRSQIEYPYPHSLPRNRERAVQWLRNAGLDVDDYMQKKSVQFCRIHFEKNQYDKKRGNGFYLKSDAVPTIFPTRKDCEPTEKETAGSGQKHFGEDRQRRKWNGSFLGKDAVPTVFHGDSDSGLQEEDEAAIIAQIAEETASVREVEPRVKVNNKDKKMCCVCSERVPLWEMLPLWANSQTATPFGRILYKLLNLAQFKSALQYCCLACSQDVLTCFKLMIQINVGAILSNRRNGMVRLPLPEALSQGCHLCGAVLPSVEEFTEHITEHVTSGTENVTNNANVASVFCNPLAQEVKLEWTSEDECWNGQSQDVVYQDVYDLPIPEESPATEFPELKRFRGATDVTITKKKKERKRDTAVDTVLPELQIKDVWGSSVSREIPTAVSKEPKPQREALDVSDSKEKEERKRAVAVKVSLPKARNRVLCEESPATESNVLKRGGKVLHGNAKRKKKWVLRVVEDCEGKDESVRRLIVSKEALSQPQPKESVYRLQPQPKESMCRLQPQPKESVYRLQPQSNVIDKLEESSAQTEHTEGDSSSDCSEASEPDNTLKMKTNHASLVKDEHCYTKVRRKKKKVRVFFIDRIKEHHPKPRKVKKYDYRERVCCHVCGGFLSKAKLKGHLRYHEKHPDAKPKPDKIVPMIIKKRRKDGERRRKDGERRRKDGERPPVLSLTCEHCGVDFDRRSFLVNHLVVCHGENLSEAVKRYSKNFVRKPWKCGVCALGVARLHTLRKHCDEQHGGEGYIQFKCEACPSSVFATDCNLRYHIRHCHDQNSFLCEKCSAHCSSKVALRRHFRTKHFNNDEIHVPRIFRCNFCPQVFHSGPKCHQHVIKEHDPSFQWKLIKKSMRS